MGRSDISISLDGDLHDGSGGFPTFVPGQKISGKVHLLLRVQKKIDRIAITFDGECFTEIIRSSGDGDDRWKETISLFNYSNTLFRGPFTMQPTTLEWPFSFTFPESSTFIRGKSDNNDNQRFDAEPQPLPPSLDVKTDGLKARVFYALTATINPDDLMGGKSSVLPLMLVPFSRISLPQPGTSILNAGNKEWRSNSLCPEQLSFKQKMSRVFTSDPKMGTPCLSFSAASYMPTSASIWQPLHLAVSTKHRVTGLTDPTHPTLILEQVIVHLWQYTEVRAKRMNDHASQLIASRTLPSRLPLSLDNTRAEITGVNKIFKLADLLPEVYRLAPSFKTYTINQSYKLKMTFTVRHQETGHPFSFKAKTPFTILPMNDPNPTQSTSVPADPLPAYRAADAGLPAYEGPSGSCVGQDEPAVIEKRQDSKTGDS